MRRMCFILATCIPVLLATTPTQAQALADTVFTWQGYGREGRCQVRLYETPPDEDRTHTIVIREIAENDGPSTLDDARLLAELVGRQFNIDPVDAYWIFHWGSFSFEGAAPSIRKELFLRATFRRTSSQNLGTPSWRLITREEVEDYTDRQFQE